MYKQRFTAVYPERKDERRRLWGLFASSEEIKSGLYIDEAVSTASCFLFIVREHPSPFMPDTFQRSLLVALQPPFAELNLQQEKHETDNQAQRISAIRSQIKPKRKINNRTGNGLSDIVAQTHLPIGTEAGHELLKACLLIKQDKRSNQHHSEGKLLPHIKSGSCRTFNNIAVTCHDQFL